MNGTTYRKQVDDWQAICPEAQLAITAAKVKQQCGRYAAMRFLQKHGGSLRLYRLACQLQAASKAGL